MDWEKQRAARLAQVRSVYFSYRFMFLIAMHSQKHKPSSSARSNSTMRTFTSSPVGDRQPELNQYVQIFFRHFRVVCGAEGLALCCIVGETNFNFTDHV
jgi:hypothetical protein